MRQFLAIADIVFFIVLLFLLWRLYCTFKKNADKKVENIESSVNRQFTQIAVMAVICSLLTVAVVLMR